MKIYEEHQYKCLLCGIYLLHQTDLHEKTITYRHPQVAKQSLCSQDHQKFIVRIEKEIM